MNELLSLQSAFTVIFVVTFAVITVFNKDPLPNWLKASLLISFVVSGALACFVALAIIFTTHP